MRPRGCRRDRLAGGLGIGIPRVAGWMGPAPGVAVGGRVAGGGGCQ